MVDLSIAMLVHQYQPQAPHFLEDLVFLSTLSRCAEPGEVKQITEDIKKEAGLSRLSHDI